MTPASFHPNLPYEAYAALPGVRSSRLRKMAKSPLHYHDEPDLDSSNRGTLRAIHALVIEGPEAMARNFAVTDLRRDHRTAAFQAFVAAHPGKTILNPGEAAEIIATANSYLRHPRAAAIITAATGREETVTWTHPGTGLAMKARLDLRNGTDVADLKTYGTTVPREVEWRATKLHAHLQAAHYVEGTAAALGVPVREITYRLLVAEGRAPWDVGVFTLVHDGALRIGFELRERLLAQLAECEAKNEWPGAAPEEAELVLPEFSDGEDLEFTTDNEEAA